MKQATKICVVTFNTTTTVLLDEQFGDDPLYAVERIVLEGALYTGDKTTIEIGIEKHELFGTSDWEPNALRVKSLKVTPAFGGARVGMLTIYYKGGSDLYMKSATVGVTAALPSSLQARL